MPPIVSIIVPVYNAEKTINRCLESIIEQTYEDWECILVNDGSTDNSGAICDFYVAQDERFRIFHKENEGVSVARNLGIEQALGKWITFVDSDDCLVNNFLFHFLEHDNQKAQLYVGGCTQKMNDEVRTIGPTKSEYVCTNGDLLNYWSNLDNFIYWFPWGKLFSREVLFNFNIRFRTDMFYSEDFTFFCDYASFIDGFCNVNHYDYVFYQTPYKGYKFKMSFLQFVIHMNNQQSSLARLEEKCGVVFPAVRNDLNKRFFRNFWGYLITLDDRKQFAEELNAFRNYKGWRQIVKNADGSKIKIMLLLYAPARWLYAFLNT